MSTVLASALRSYLKHHWRDNPGGFLFPRETNTPFKGATAVKWGLKPVLKKLRLPTMDVGFHAFRHGCGTALANSGASPKTVQRILRHSDIKTTFR